MSNDLDTLFDELNNHEQGNYRCSVCKRPITNGDKCWIHFGRPLYTDWTARISALPLVGPISGYNFIDEPDPLVERRQPVLCEWCNKRPATWSNGDGIPRVCGEHVLPRMYPDARAVCSVCDAPALYRGVVAIDCRYPDYKPGGQNIAEYRSCEAHRIAGMDRAPRPFYNNAK